MNFIYPIILLLSVFPLMINAQTVNKNKVQILNSSELPNYVIKELKTIAFDAREFKVSISSKQRTVRKQVEIMLNYYITCDSVSNAKDKSECGIELAKKVYDIECHAGFYEFNKNNSRQLNVERMTKALTNSLIQLGEERVCMNHVIIPNVKTKIIAVDIKPSSINNHKAFYLAVKNNGEVVQFYYPEIKGVPKSEVKDAAFHIGFFRQ